MKTISYTELQVGNIVHFYGARFEITRAELIQRSGTEMTLMSANGVWIDGATVKGYFGPTKDWHFQGNLLAKCTVE